MGENMSSTISSFAMVITGFAIAFSKSWKLALVIIACMPVMGLVGMFMMKSLKKYTSKSQIAYAHAGSIVEQAFGGIRTVYAFSLQERFCRIFDTRLAVSEESDAKRGVAIGFGAGGFVFTLYSMYGLAFWYGSKLVIRKELSGGTMTIVFFAMLTGAMALITIPTSIQAIALAQSAAYRVFSVINRKPKISIESAGIRKEHLEGTIEFQEVSFAYPTRPSIPVLKGFSAIIPSGKTVAIVGPSGSGKSTTVALVQRWYDVLDGSVLIDGNNIREYNLQWLREQIGVVGQEPVLFNMTIRQNILLGATKPVTEQKFIEVCKMANCHTFICNLPEGYETNVGEHGSMLSGGQKQRIAIARALIKDPRILLLDEATSALDTASERKVQIALEAASQNRTTLVIAHRLSTAQHADCIVVLKDGVMVEHGTHQSLLANEGLYYDLVHKQHITDVTDDRTAAESSQKPIQQTSHAIVEMETGIIKAQQKKKKKKKKKSKRKAGS
eukprot:Phypoly_transcript_01241.p2 GENE.Phypoly_transcript_01241~~Phypoly_transcript_01241.p2  ORF type:complete len:571 (+),score=92.86 Phypoly_transcript_01241:219-1715(+)